MTQNENEDEHIITGISNDELNDNYDMATDENTIADKQQRMFDDDDDAIFF